MNDSNKTDKHTPGPWKASKQINSRSFMAQVFGPDGHSLAIIETTREDETANANAELIAQAPALREENERLKAFKKYVHDRLDGMGIPIDPDSPHKAAGCRIGGRMDEVEKILAKVEELRLLLLRAEMYVLPTEQTNGLLKEIRKALE